MRWLLLVPPGALLMWAGQVDDSPGLGGIGLLMILTGLVLTVRRVRDRRP